MDSVQPKENENFVELKKAAQLLGVSVSDLLDWNDDNILKPVITQDGRVGYKKDQLIKFISVQKSFQPVKNDNTQNPDVNTPSSELPIAQTNVVSQSSGNLKSQEFVHKKHLSKQSPSYMKLISIGLFSFIIMSSVSLLLTSPNRYEQTNFVEIVDSNGTNDVKLSTSSVNITHSPSVEINNLTNSGDDRLEILDNKLSYSKKAYERVAQKYTKQDDSKNDPENFVLAEGTSDIIPYPEMKDPINIGAGIISELAARPNFDPVNENPDSSFDEDGNLNLDAQDNQLLTSNLDPLINIGSSSSKNANWFTLVIIFSFGLYLVYLNYNKRALYANGHTSSSTSVSPEVLSSTLLNKLFEVDQKADGAVVVYHKDKEYKISKPELNSETDQLIQRLLGLMGPENKEIDYDIIKDERLNLNAPLSKVVTRLGFVGIKRDLFFPRTSKNKIIFRRYITKEDLESMNIGLNLVLNELKD